MKLLFLVKMNENAKAGLFIATHNRIKALKANYTEYDIDIYSLVKYDNWLLKLIKKILNKQIQSKFNKDSFEYEGIRYKYIYYKNSIFRRILESLGIDIYLKSTIKDIDKVEQYNLISAHWGSPQGSLAYYINKKYNIPYVITLHGSDVHTLPFQNKSYRKILLRNLNYAKLNLFVSKKLLETAKELGWEDDTKSFVSYNAIDRNLFYPISKKEINHFKLKNNFNNYIVGFVGNLIKIKRADWLINIFNETQKKFSQNISFLIIGDGELKTQIINESNKCNIDVRIIGKIPQDKLPIYYNIMNCLILPSKNEGLPNVILEAQACGVPVIATETGGIPEAIANKDYLVKNDEKTLIEDFSDIIVEILKSTEKIDIENNSWEKIVEKELKLFDKYVLKKNET